MAGPWVATIVLAHDRREFLRGAIGSIEASDTGLEGVERILVKAFDDPPLDAELSSRGWAVITTDAVPLGAKLALGVARATAPIVTFLEDDDLYEPARLGAIREAFATDPSLGFFRNAHTFVGPDGSPVPPPGGSSAPRELEQLGTVAASPRELPGILDKLVRIDPAFNLSAIAARREHLAPRLLEFQPMAAAVDSAVLFASLRGGGGVRIDARRLTRYRLHGGNLSLLGPTEEQIARFLHHQKQFLDAFRPVYLACLSEGPPTARRLAGTEYFGTRLLHDVLGDNAPRAQLWSDLVALWRWAPLSAFRARRDWLLYGGLGLLSASVARRAYFLRRALPNA